MIVLDVRDVREMGRILRFASFSGIELFFARKENQDEQRVDSRTRALKNRDTFISVRIQIRFVDVSVAESKSSTGQSFSTMSSNVQIRNWKNVVDSAETRPNMSKLSV
jgi:hypothetical protein